MAGSEQTIELGEELCSIEDAICQHSTMKTRPCCSSKCLLPRTPATELNPKTVDLIVAVGFNMVPQYDANQRLVPLSICIRYAPLQIYLPGRSQKVMPRSTVVHGQQHLIDILVTRECRQTFAVKIPPKQG